MKRIAAFVLILALVVAIPASVHGQGAGVNSRAGISAAVTCANTVTSVAVTNLARVSILLVNNDVVTIFWGSNNIGQGGLNTNQTTLTTANGIPITPGASVTIEGYLGEVNCITVSASANLRVWEESR